MFSRTMASSETIREFTMQSLPMVAMTVGQLRQLALSIPNVEVLQIKATWGGEAVRPPNLRPKPQLTRCFSLERLPHRPLNTQEPAHLLLRPPVGAPSHLPLRRTRRPQIRSERNGDFRIISCFGTSMEVEIRRRIRESRSLRGDLPPCKAESVSLPTPSQSQTSPPSARRTNPASSPSPPPTLA
ncbi:hypothetical protein AAT19DRAFT_13162 [Rhodotorula toruloides]|uniref:Uncharacterized protein n=1 Tax=Rhodotorula toruloides TaxID=5286 RepID=A0A2T0ADR7_RHOTO|nr:hypothetical protein AAT19DRAFT_13162 [Rhodotorula toruloides]